MGLSPDEKKALKRLQEKANEPDPPAASRALNISLDLGDEKQVKLAGKLGLLSDIFDSDDDDTDDDTDDTDDDDHNDEPPRRRGYFKDAK